MHVLIVDDGSTPPIVAPDLPGLMIDVLRMPQNGGIERALAAGIDAPPRASAMPRASTRAISPRRSASRRRVSRRPPARGLRRHVDASRVPRRRAALHADPPADPRTLRRTRFLRSPLVHPSVMLRIDAVRKWGTIGRNTVRPRISIFYG